MFTAYTGIPWTISGVATDKTPGCHETAQYPSRFTHRIELWMSARSARVAVLLRLTNLASRTALSFSGSAVGASQRRQFHGYLLVGNDIAERNAGVEADRLEIDHHGAVSRGQAHV